MEKHVLILSDFVGFGNVAMATSRAVLTKLGCTALCLPTALISNTWNFGAVAQLDTTEYLKASLENFAHLGFRLDAVLIGYIADEDQAQWLGQQCRKWHQDGIPVFLDPIFADNGKLYRGITWQRLDFLRQLLPYVDYALPNVTEARFLTGCENPMEALAALGSANALITGVTQDEESAVLLKTGGACTALPYDPIPGNYSGAGDAFTALFLGKMLLGSTSTEAAQYAITTTRRWILQSKADNWRGMGLPVERYDINL